MTLLSLYHYCDSETLCKGAETREFFAVSFDGHYLFTGLCMCGERGLWELAGGDMVPLPLVKLKFCTLSLEAYPESISEHIKSLQCYELPLKVASPFEFLVN